ncbi:translational GTPase TypA [Patescibacteria group bacterium]|nr:translational GTPase TypA [Patescibacteria group bacterium]
MNERRENIRNIAIIAHVDHGKTTLVDAMLKQTHTVKDQGADLIMDSMDLERERGITIKAKNASITYNGVKINIIDTPGHADFGGEVERTLKMADGVLLLVDAKEGPMPQTKFVLRKALELGHKAIVVINKVDRNDAQAEEVVNKTFDLFVDLKASDHQLDFPIIYASAVNGIASTHQPHHPGQQALADLQSKDLTPLFETILKTIPAPEADTQQPFAMLVLAIAYDAYKGKMGTGKIQSGKVTKAMNVVRIKRNGEKTTGKIGNIMAFEGLAKTEVQEAVAGDIVSISGFDDIEIGETIADAVNPVQIDPVHIEEPTVRMTFAVNNSPFAGREGKFVTSRNLRERLMKELETNVALRVDETGSTDSFLVSGRGELHLAILIETMRREGFELQVSQPEVIFKEENSKKLEPFEMLTVDVPSEYQGPVIEELGKRGGELRHMESNAAGEIHADYFIPTRGLIGLKNSLLTKTRGTAILNNLFDSYQPVADAAGLEQSNSHGSLISAETGVSNAYGLNNAQERGTLFIGAAVDVYEGMIVGKNNFDSDLEINVCKTKKLTNMRSSGADDAIILVPPREITLDFALEYIGNDELVEVTPKSIRLRKRILNATERKRSSR